MSPSPTVVINTEAQSPSDSQKSPMSLAIIIGAASGVSLLSAVFFLVLCYRRRQRRASVEDPFIDPYSNMTHSPYASSGTDFPSSSSMRFSASSVSELHRLIALQPRPTYDQSQNSMVNSVLTRGVPLCLPNPHPRAPVALRVTNSPETSLNEGSSTSNEKKYPLDFLNFDPASIYPPAKSYDPTTSRDSRSLPVLRNRPLTGASFNEEGQVMTATRLEISKLSPQPPATPAPSYQSLADRSSIRASIRR